jgi:sugar-specific transcriptional regulator TrmB
MSEFDEAVEALRELDLSEYEARAYAALLAMGELTPQEVSSAANIPYTKVYEVLKRLEAKGWVVAVSRTPLVYAPKRPEEAIAQERRKVEEKLRRAEEKLKALEKAGAVATGIYVLRSFTALARAVRSIVAESEEVLAMLSTPQLLKEIEDLLAKARVRGVIEASVQTPRHGEWKRIPLIIPLDMVVGDRAKLVLHFGLLTPHGGPSGVLVLDEEVASAASKYFERIWEAAEIQNKADK